MYKIKFTKEEVIKQIEQTIDMYNNAGDTMREHGLDQDTFHPFMCGWMYAQLEHTLDHLRD